MASQKHQPRIVLDTSCVRGLPRHLLQVLRDRGFDIYLSGLALSEFAVYFAPGATVRQIERQPMLRARMQFLLNFFEGAVALAPTHTPLVDKLGGRMIGIDAIPFQPWLKEMQRSWKELVQSSSSSELTEFTLSTAAYVDETGQDLVDTLAVAGGLGEMTAEEIALARKLGPLIPSILDRIELPGTMSAPERFDAYTRVQELHVQRAHARSAGRLPAIEPNHAIDINMLQHLAEGLLVVTCDYELVEDVDASGSAQAPWVRTIGELLTGRRCGGLPFGYGARIASRKHGSRKRAELAKLDRMVADHHRAKPQ